MSELVFDRQTKALTSERGELARVDPSTSAESWGRIVLAGEEREIGRHAHHGWAFQVESGDQVLWRFHAGWRRGGVMEGAGGRLHLSSALVHTGRWTLASRAEGHVTIQRHEESGRSGGWSSLSVETDGPFWEAGDGLLALTFACWLVGEFEETPNMGGSPI
jgi:hypothetical protein